MFISGSCGMLAVWQCYGMLCGCVCLSKIQKKKMYNNFVAWENGIDNYDWTFFW